MVMSFRSQTFHNTLDEVTEKINAGELSANKDAITEYIENKQNINTEEFLSANKKYQEALGKGEVDFRALQTSDKDIEYVPDKAIESAIRAGGRFVGQMTPEFIQEGLKDIVPEGAAQYVDEFFDPYHGEGLYAAGEQFVPVLASYITAGGLAKKIGTGAIKSIKGNSPATRALMSKIARTSGEKGRKLGKAAGSGVAFAAGAAAVETAEDNIANVLRETFPESTEFLDRLATDPDDSFAETKLKGFMANLGLGAAFAPLAVANAYKKPLVQGLSYITSPVGKLYTGTATAVGNLPVFNSGLIARGLGKLSSRMGTDDTMLALEVEASQAGRAALERAKGLSLDLKDAVKKEYGKETASITGVLDDALAGNQRALNSLKEPVKEIVKEMRGNLTSLSKEFGKGTKGNLKTKVNKNADTYITQTYDLFEDPQYAKQVLKDFKNFKKTGKDVQGKFRNALNAIKSSGVKDDAAAMTMLDDLLKKTKTSDEALDMFQGLTGFRNSNLSVKSGFKKQENIPDGILDILKPGKNPYENYINTFTNLSNLTAQQKYLKDVASHLKTKGLVSTGVGTGKNTHLSENLGDVMSTKLGAIFGKGSSEMLDNPLEGLYTTDVYKNAIQNGLDLMSPANELSKLFMRAKGFTQTTQTVLSPITHGRNVMGNMILTVANGMIPVSGFKEAAKSIDGTGIAKKLSGMSNKEIAEQYARYVDLGVVNSNLEANIVRRNLKAFDTDAEKWISNASVVKPVKKLNKKITDLYQAEDDFFKIAHFENTKNYLRKSKMFKNFKPKLRDIDRQLTKIRNNPKFNKLSESKARELALKNAKEEGLERMAAERTRDLMPNYNLVPRAVKSLRGMPFGDYVSFPAEMTRISKNLAKYTLKDLTSGDEVLFKEGAKRAAGITAAGVAGDALVDFSARMVGLTEEDTDAINNLVSSYEHNQDRIYLSGLYEDDRGHKRVDYINLGPIDPFSYLKVMGRGMHELIGSGEVDDTRSTEELQRIAAGLFESAAGPFVAPSMITEAFIKTLEGKRIEEEGKGGLSNLDYVQAAIAPLVEVATPKFVDMIFKRQEYEKSLAKNQEKGINVAVKPNSFASWPDGETGDVFSPATYGIKKQSLDLTAGTRYAFGDVIRDIENADSRFKKFVDKNPNLTKEDYPELLDLYIGANNVRVGELQRLRSLTENYEQLYGDMFDDEVQKGLSLKNQFTIPETTMDYIAKAQQGVNEPIQFEKTNLRLQEIGLPDELFETADKIYNIYRDVGIE